MYTYYDCNHVIYTTWQNKDTKLAFHITELIYMTITMIQWFPILVKS